MKKKIAFVCVGNSCRSQIAEGFTLEYGKDLFEVYSAGTHPSNKVNPNAITVMKEINIDISKQHPKTLKEIPEKLDVVITMGCGVVCPVVGNNYQEDWGLDDPVGQPIEVFKKTRNIIEQKVKELIQKEKEGKLEENSVKF